MADLYLLEGASATNNAPSGATAGVRLWKTTHFRGTGLWRGTDSAIVRVSATITSAGTGSLTIKLWGYDGAWTPLGTNTDSSLKGVLNEGTALAETGTDVIEHSEIVSGLSAFQRIYAQIVAETDLSAVDVYLVALPGAVRTEG